jgi:hypothetical protein
MAQALVSFQKYMPPPLPYFKVLGFLQKKEHFIEYLVQVFWFERNRCQNA